MQEKDGDVTIRGSSENSARRLVRSAPNHEVGGLVGAKYWRLGKLVILLWLHDMIYIS